MDRRPRGVDLVPEALRVVPVGRAGDLRALAAVPVDVVAAGFGVAALGVAALAVEGRPAFFAVVDLAVAGLAALDALDELAADLAVGLVADRAAVDLAALDLRVVDFLVVAFVALDLLAGLVAAGVVDALVEVDLVPVLFLVVLAAVDFAADFGAVDVVVGRDAAADRVPADALVADFFADRVDLVAGRAVADVPVAAVRAAVAVLVPVRVVVAFLRVVRRLGTAARNPRIRVPGLIGDTAVAAVAAADPTPIAAPPSTVAALPAAVSARSPMRATSAATSAAASPA